MRKDVKIGMLAGTVFSIAAVVWFCIQQQIVRQPKIEQQADLIETQRQNKNEPLQSWAADSPDEKPAPEQAVMHTVKSGESLSDIAKLYYGSAANWKKIYEANIQQFPKGPNVIKAGMKIIIPQ